MDGASEYRVVVYREYRAYVYGDVWRTGSCLAGADTMGWGAGVFMGSIASVDSEPYVDRVSSKTRIFRFGDDS